MSRHRKRRRDGRLFYSGACYRCGRKVLLLASDYRGARALAAVLGRAVAVACTSCARAACAASGRPVAVLRLQDEAVAARLRQYAAEQN
jgi:hypothetical protein